MNRPVPASSHFDMQTFPRATYLIAAVTIATGLTTAIHPGQAQDADIQTVYATEKGACGRGPKTRIEITKGRVTGPGFDCVLAKSRPAGTGLVAYPGAICTVDGRKSSDGIAFDLGNFQDHFKLSLPGREKWLSLYPCTPVPGLKFTQ